MTTARERIDVKINAKRRQRNPESSSRHSEQEAATRVLELNGFDQNRSQHSDVVGPTEHDMALTMASRALPTLRWSPSLLWMHYNGRNWERDAMQRHMELARDVAQDTAVDYPKLRSRLSTARTRNAIAALAQGDPRLKVPTAAWDAEPLLLNTPAGIVDLRTGELRARTSSDYVTVCTAVAPGHFDEAHRWQQFLAELFPDAPEMIGFMQRSVGYMLTGDVREQALWFWHGAGHNGKSILCGTIIWLMGTYAMKLPATSLMLRHYEGHPTDIAGLRGKRLAVSSELEQGQHFAEAKIKELTGDATATARFQHQDFFQFTLTHKHLIVGNHKPRLHGDDPAMRRRMLLVPFDQKFSGDRRDMLLAEKLKAEGPAILAWAIRGAVLWHASGLMVPQSVHAATAEYFADNNDLAAWVAECCVRIGSEKATPLYQSFARFKRERGESAPSMTQWGTRMSQFPGVTKRVSQSVVYDGIALSPAERSRGNDANGPRNWYGS